MHTPSQLISQESLFSDERFGIMTDTQAIDVVQYNTNFIHLSNIEHVKHEAYVQKRKYLCSVMAAIEKKQQHTHTLTHT